jgi:NAD(P)-dependent dehydrogenase (short-subunit alcohol dehydrogenase family)
MEIIKDKNVLIVGATGGIGKATALLLKQSGANLFITSSNENKLAELSAQLDLPSNQTFLLDITDANAVRNVAENIHQQIPAIDILINAAGIGIIKPIENLTEQDFMQTVQVNLAGAFYLVKNFIEPMKIAKKGLIINIPGVLGKTPMAGAAAYSASKYGLNGMMKSIREELKRTDIPAPFEFPAVIPLVPPPYLVINAPVAAFNITIVLETVFATNRFPELSASIS